MLAERYTPGFVDRDPEKGDKVEFKNSAELLNISWVKQWREDPSFHRISIKRGQSKEHRGPYAHAHKIMAEREGGYVWYVIGIIRDEDISAIDDIPEAEFRKRKLTYK